MNDPGQGPFFGVSLEEQTTHSLAWLASGKRAEEHEAVRPPIDKLPDDFEPIAPVSVQKTWADQSFIHCNACNTREKFRDNGHIATAGNGWWYIVGPECGSPEHVSRLRQRLNGMRHRDFLRTAEGDVRALATKFPAWLQFIEQLRGVVGVADKGHRFITTKRASLHAHLDNARRGDGQLTVLTTVQQANMWGEMEDRDMFVPFARVEGLASIAKPCIAVEHFKRAESAFADFADQEALDDAIAEAVSRGKQAELHKRLSGGIEAARECHKAVLEARAFWSESNLATIASWAVRPDSRYEMKFPRTRRGSDLELVSEANETWVLRGFETLLSYSAEPPAR